MKKALQIFQKKANNFQEFERELAMYQQSLAIMPKLLSANYPFLTIQLLDAIPIGKMEEPDFGKIAALYSILHTKTKNGETCLCHVDCNPKNILYEEKTGDYYLIDFAESKLAYPETDVIKFLLFWASIQTHSLFRISSSHFWQTYQKSASINHAYCHKIIMMLEEEFDERRNRFKKNEHSAGKDVEKNRLFMRRLFSQSQP